MTVCSECGAENREPSPTCRMCLSPLAVDKELPRPEFVETIIEPSQARARIRCPACEAPNDLDFKFCQECGGQLEQAAVFAKTETFQSGNLSETSTPHLPSISQAQTPHMPSRETSPDHPKMTPAPASGARLLCPSCGHGVQAGSVFCNRCGTRLSVDRTVVMPSPKPMPKYRLRVIVDGEETDELYSLGSQTYIGRVNGDINFPFDDYMSSRHASITRRDDHYVLQDEKSRNGTFFMLSGEVDLKPGDVFMIGKQLFKFEVEE